ncbi:MAG: nucleotidyltransferase family protein [Anaerolineales bacterium]
MISAIILAAGSSRRMGQPKMLLPWGKVTVIEHVIATFMDAGIQDILLVTGGAHEQVEESTVHYPIRRIYNKDHAAGEMLSSLRCGLRALETTPADAALIGLGDQPQVEAQSVRSIRAAYHESRSRLIVPSFQRRRGHPWLVARPLWEELLAMQPPESPRDFLNKHANEIHYVDVNTPSILADLDTPEDYQRSHP